ncbi:MAG: hypothetical protein AAB802_04180 [Patescibacteria group bacterium]
MRKEIALLGALAACDLPSPPKEMKKTTYHMVDSEKELGNTEPEDIVKPHEVEVVCDSAHAPFEIKTFLNNDGLINGVATQTKRLVRCALDETTGELRLDMVEEVTCEDGTGYDAMVGQHYVDKNLDGKIDSQGKFMGPTYSVKPTAINERSGVGVLAGKAAFHFPSDDKDNLTDMPVPRRWAMGEHPRNEKLPALCSDVIQGRYPIQNLNW